MPLKKTTRTKRTAKVEALERRVAELEAALQQAKKNATPVPAAAPTVKYRGKARDGAIAQGENAFAMGANASYVGAAFVQFITQIVQSGERAEEVQLAVGMYLHSLSTELAGINLGEIDDAAGSAEAKREPLRLSDIYVPLNTTLGIPEKTSLAKWLKQQPSKGREPRAESELRPVSALEALAAHPAMTLLGKPGSGKSTFGAEVLLALAQVWQGHEGELAKLGSTWTYGPLMPIRMVLRRFADQLPKDGGDARAGDLWAFLGRELEASGLGLAGSTVRYIERLAHERGAFVLFDGLDECGSSELRARVQAGVTEFMRALKKSRFLLTARPYAWETGAKPESGVYALADLDDEQIEQFIEAFYQALKHRGWITNLAEADRKKDDLLAARHRSDLEQLARNPLLLTLMASLHASRGRLPDDRVDLYDASVILLMLRWNRQIGADKALLDELDLPGLKLLDLRGVLEKVAYEIHAESSAATNTEAAADVGEDRLIRAFMPALRGDRNKAAVVVDYIEKRAGLLIGHGERNGERQFSFPHRTFQEFLAACHLAARQDFAKQCLHLASNAPRHWQVVLPLAARIAKAERGATAADELVGGKDLAQYRKARRPEPAMWLRAYLAATQLNEIGLSALNTSERERTICARVVEWISASLSVHPQEGGLPASQRAAAGDVLASLGDPRFDADRFYLPADQMLGFVRIAADTRFRIGSRRADAKRIAAATSREPYQGEINEALTPTPEYYIARYPVTVAQFKAFVEASGFELRNALALRDPGNRPVRYVSWHDAMAYCHWLDDLLRTKREFKSTPVGRLLASGTWCVGLPSELEWEKAARGGLVDKVFAWGDEPDPNRANYNESDVNDTSSVGCFPANGYGLYDMVGNVWEWCLSEFAKYPYKTEDGRENTDGTADRVVRGGAFFSDRGYARCASRLSALPDYRYYFIGFRVVLRASPV